jgi:hypothetical protein
MGKLIFNYQQRKKARAKSRRSALARAFTAIRMSAEGIEAHGGQVRTRAYAMRDMPVRLALGIFRLDVQAVRSRALESHYNARKRMQVQGGILAFFSSSGEENFQKRLRRWIGRSALKMQQVSLMISCPLLATPSLGMG